MRRLLLALLLFASWQSGLAQHAKSGLPKQAPSVMPRFAPVIQSRVKNREFAEVLNIAERVQGPVFYASEVSDIGFFSQVFACCNGPGDLTLEMCDCSVNYYISTGIHDLPNDFRLFKVGPFYTVDTAYLKAQSPGYLLTIKHRKGKRRLTTRYQIAFESVTRLKS